MADEVSISLIFVYDKSTKIKRTESFTADVTGESQIHAVQTVDTSEEALTSHSDIGTPAWCFVKNLDTANFITIGATGSLNMTLLAGESCVFRTNVALYAQADTAACEVEYIIIEL